MGISLAGVAPSQGVDTGLSIFEQYPAASSRLKKGEIKSIKRYARTLSETSPSDAASYLAQTRGYTNWRPESFIAKLGSQPVDYNKYRDLGASAFQDFLGRQMSYAEWNQTSSLAKTKGIKDPAAFDAFLSQRIASTPEGQAKMKTEADIAWESQYGTMPRDAQGNLIRGQVHFNPAAVRSMANTMLGIA
jgi:hypothetical protein